MKTRALSHHDKQAKRSLILDAARALFLLNDRQLPSVISIAQQAGLAKGTVYLYFQTKEEIFLSLLEQEFHGLLQTLREQLGVVADGMADADMSADQRAAFARQLIAGILAYLDAHPAFLRLDAMTYSVLEQNLSEAFLRDFKIGLTLALNNTGSALDKALQLPAGRGTSLLLRSHALIRGLWQSLDYPEHLRKLLEAPEFAAIRPDFRTELQQALDEYWRGALA